MVVVDDDDDASGFRSHQEFVAEGCSDRNAKSVVPSLTVLATSAFCHTQSGPERGSFSRFLC